MSKNFYTKSKNKTNERASGFDASANTQQEGDISAGRAQ